MIALDGTENKAKLGANAILAVSLATAKAAADAARPAALQISRRTERQGAARADDEHHQRRRALRCADRFPGIHDRAEGLRHFSRRLRAGMEIFHSLKSVLKDRGLSTAVGDEGGFAPKLESADDALETIAAAVKNAGYKFGKDVFIALDVAASRILRQGQEAIRLQENPTARSAAPAELVDFYADSAAKYPDHLDRRRLRGKRLGRLEEAHRRARRQGAARRRRSVRDQRGVPRKRASRPARPTRSS